MVRFLMVLVAICLVALGLEGFRFLAAGPGRVEETVVFEVPNGISFHQIARRLQDKGVVSDSLKLRVLAKVTGQGGAMKRGEYLLNKAMTPQEVLSVLASGKSIQYPVTFAEGSNMFEMAALLESKKLFRAIDFLNACRDKELIKKLLGVELSSLEGYLFPETYNVTKFTPLYELITLMVTNFKSAYSSIEASQKAPLSRHEVVTLASMVEKETGAAAERPMIASVFFNRLAKGMKIQSDPTTIYGIWVETGAFKQNITHADLVNPTPYNTYTVARLPFGPISNPGRESLAAVFAPATSEYLYFVSRNDGTHVFTKTYEDHLKAVKGFQLNPAAREGKSWRDLKKSASSGN